MGIKEMTHGAITAKQKELLESGTDAGFFEEPEQAFNRDIDNVVGSLFACGTVQDVCNILHGFANNGTIGDRAVDSLETRVMFKSAVVTERTDGEIRVSLGLKQTLNEVATDFSGSTGDKDAIHRFH
jgi:hypothetical protein